MTCTAVTTIVTTVINTILTTIVPMVTMTTTIVSTVTIPTTTTTTTTTTITASHSATPTSLPVDRVKFLFWEIPGPAHDILVSLVVVLSLMFLCMLIWYPYKKHFIDDPARAREIELARLEVQRASMSMPPPGTETTT